MEIDIPLITGQNESKDPKLLRVLPPEGLFTRAENVRWRKDGRAAKRYGAAAVSTTVVSGSFDEEVNFLASWQGNRVVGAGGSLYQDTTDGWYRQGRYSQFAPVRVVGVGRNESGATKLQRPTSLFLNGFWHYAWDDGTSIYVLITTEEGAAIISKIVNAGIRPRWVATGTTARLIYQDNLTIKHVSWDAGLSQTGAATVGTTPLGTVDHAWDAAPLSSTHWLWIGQIGSQIEVDRISGTTGVDQALINEGFVAPNCYPTVMGTSGEKVYAAWVINSTGEIRVRTFDDDLTGASATTSVETNGGNNDQPGLVRSSSTTACLVWGGLSNTGNQGGKLNYCTMTSNTAGTITTAYNVRASSRPFVANGLRHVLASTDNRGGFTVTGEDGWSAQRTYWVITLDSLPRGGLNCWPVRSYPPLNRERERLSDVTTSGSRWCIPVLHELRSDRLSSSDTATIGIDAIHFTDQSMSVSLQNRETIEAAGALHITGGYLAEYIGGGYVVPNNFAVYAPGIIGVTDSAGGNVDDGAHIYRAVYETIDRLGRRHRSAPSNPATATTGAGNNTVAVSYSTLGFGSPFDRDDTVETVLHVYRTKAGEVVHHRVTPGIGAPSVFPLDAAATYTDTLSDSDSATSELLYTDGGRLPNITAPACRFATESGTRVWLGGLLYADRAIASKVIVPGEPVQFTDHESHQAVFPTELTGIKGMDGALVGFTLEGAYVVYGDGPDDTGQGAFAEPRRIAGSVGCIDNRSIVDTPQGLLFQSQRGMFLLPRGFGTPIFVGDKFQDTIAAYPNVTGAVRVSQASEGASALGEDTVRIALADSNTAPTASRVLVLDLKTGQWSVDTPPVAIAAVGLWDGAFAYARKELDDSSPLRADDVGAYSDAGAFVATLLETGDLRLFGVSGRGMVRKFVLLGEYRAACTVNVAMSTDNGLTWTNVATYALSGLTTGERVSLRWALPVRYLSEVRFRLSDSNASVSEGFVFNALTLEVDKLPGTRPIGPSYRAG